MVGVGGCTGFRNRNAFTFMDEGAVRGLDAGAKVDTVPVSESLTASNQRARDDVRGHRRRSWSECFTLQQYGLL